MNAVDILMYGNRTFHSTLARIPREEWNTPGVCGVWSVKEIIAHLASYEEMLADILRSFLGSGETPHLDRYLQQGMAFNDLAVEARQAQSSQEAIAEYDRHHGDVMSLIARLPVELLRQPGTLTWYGAEYALDDYFVYQFYGHKREHSAQIAVFSDVLEQQAASAVTA
jgi:hypothetical protein